jgi:hypothetical protein
MSVCLSFFLIVNHLFIFSEYCPRHIHKRHSPQSRFHVCRRHLPYIRLVCFGSFRLPHLFVGFESDHKRRGQRRVCGLVAFLLWIIVFDRQFVYKLHGNTVCTRNSVSSGSKRKDTTGSGLVFTRKFWR